MKNILVAFALFFLGLGLSADSQFYTDLFFILLSLCLIVLAAPKVVKND